MYRLLYISGHFHISHLHLHSHAAMPQCAYEPLKPKPYDQDKWAAQRALYRDGEQLSRSLMIGVRPLDELHR